MHHGEAKYNPATGKATYGDFSHYGELAHLAEIENDSPKALIVDLAHATGTTAAVVTVHTLLSDKV